MAAIEKNQQEILEKLGIEQLNEMQLNAHHAIFSNTQTVLFSPTGTGKTLAFLLPMISEMNSNIDELQSLIVVPSRELAIQIQHVVLNMGTGYRVHAFYGGRSVNKDRLDLKARPSILIGTPGRVADHIRRGRLDPSKITTLVMDEYDKSIEVGFQNEMEQIIDALRNRKKTILTSATKDLEFPYFLKIENPEILDYLGGKEDRLIMKEIVSPDKDKIPTLINTLSFLQGKRGIIFCNYKDTIDRIYDHLRDKNIDTVRFYGGMEQKDREQSLIKFRNSSANVLLSTDLAARGIDVPELDFIIHYHIPHREQEFTHRNGRTARVNAEGTSYVLRYQEEDLPEFIPPLDQEYIDQESHEHTTEWATIKLNGGRKDRISKGDVAGFFFKKGLLEKGELGMIELYQDASYAAVKKEKVQQVILNVDNEKLKTKKVRARLI